MKGKRILPGRGTIEVYEDADVGVMLTQEDVYKDVPDTVSIPMNDIDTVCKWMQEIKAEILTKQAAE